VHVPVVYEDNAFTRAAYAQIYFPSDQVTELAAALPMPGERR